MISSAFSFQTPFLELLKKSIYQPLQAGSPSWLASSILLRNKSTEAEQKKMRNISAKKCLTRPFLKTVNFPVNTKKPLAVDTESAHNCAGIKSYARESAISFFSARGLSGPD
jgi:hypothetical protein